MLRWKSSLKPAAAAPATGITLEGHASNSGHSGYNAGSRNMSASYPAVSANDIMLLIVATSSTCDLTSSPPTGWTKVFEQDGYSTTSTIGMYWKLATSSASASTGNSWPEFVNQSENYYVWVGAYSGCDTTNPIDAHTGGAQGYNSTWNLSITTQTNNAMVVTAYSHSKTSMTATFSDGTEVVSTYFRNTAYIAINEKIEATAGSHTRSATMSSAVQGAKAAISLKPTGTLSTPTLLGTRAPSGNSRTSTSVDISSATEGALLIAAVTVRSVQQSLSAPTEGGWTLLSQVDNGDSSNRPLSRVYYKTAGASESTVTWTHSSEYTSAVAIEIVGADTSTLAVTTGYRSRVLGVVTVPTSGIVIAVHGKGDNADTSSSTVRSSDGSTQTQYTMVGDVYGGIRSGTAIAWGDVGAGDTNGTDYIQGAGGGNSTATHHIAIKPA